MSSDDPFLAAAVSVGRRIVADAVWHNGVCSWMGAVLDPGQPHRMQYRALEPNLYDGSAGVGLFLAQLTAVTGDGAFRGPAVGALRHAVARAGVLPLDRRDGFHAGSLGVAWAATRAAALIDAEQLRAAALPVTAPPPAAARRCPDVITGCAGALLGLLALGDVDSAVTAGEELIAAATVTRRGWSWADPVHRHPQHLCGLSHGAAGIGWALLELFAATDDERFKAAAIGAFAYERSWLAAESGTWPDLRIGGVPAAITSPAVGTWCHGEAGIALTRLRAIEVIGADAVRRDAELALETTRRHLAASLPYEIDDLTLCHGAAGTADVLLCAAAAPGGQWSDAAEVAADLGRVALERYGTAAEDWACGMAGGTTPALFRGLSGIGWWLLRLHDPTIESPLLLPLLTPGRARA